MTTPHRAAGTHLLADLSGIAPALLADCGRIEALLRDAALAAGARIVHSHFHPFGPGLGVTGVVLLAESHISVHTWPEHGFAAVDIFMCGAAAPQRALDVLREALAPRTCTVRSLQRGVDESATR
ncbi:S-adenosylmethionine decarboxylase [Pseudoduganella flava]|uniref:S-adenosylmethionine decarboxylase proenzyme n=1 Tax=Pseudoduganella flava TaxID=871742 RepID=A0A562PN53_9BURK|nr:adenosylmethionine decarboxylase [Pseudoduganella flava]QGZ40446.1 adenosylmethionine decarboxylase [Pseudoduganella flava]TWI45885.1 S-adenosylmethionine decarboxylase [Pseudoduganella flava]